MRARLLLLAAAGILLRAPAAAQVDLQTRLKDVHVERTGQGDRVVLDTSRGEERLEAREFVGRLFDAQQEQRRRGFLYVLFNITTPWGFLWVTIGFAGQALFTFRMVLQWLVSEKHKRSIVPVGFWWGSLFGGLLLLVYFSWRKDIVGIVGQSTGAFIYIRNLVLIYRLPPGAREPTIGDDAGPEPELDR